MSAAKNTKARSAEIAAATAKYFEMGWDDFAVINIVMAETNCARAIAIKHRTYYLHPELRPVNGGANRGQGRKKGSKDRGARDTAKIFYVSSNSRWFLVKAKTKRSARSEGVKDFGRGMVSEVRVATAEDIRDYERDKEIETVY